MFRNHCKGSAQIRRREPVERGLLLNPEWRPRIAFPGRKLAGAKGALTWSIRIPGILGTLHVKLSFATRAIHIAYFVHFLFLNDRFLSRWVDNPLV